MARCIAQRTCLDGTRLSLTRYDPFESQPVHSHSDAGASFILAGSLDETSGDGRVAAACLWGVFKPPRLEHADRFGPRGALLLRISTTRASPQSAWAWAETPSPEPWLALTRSVLKPPTAGPFESGIHAAIGTVQISSSARLRPAPDWLREARDLLGRDRPPPIGSVAARLGTHRVHLGRAFHACFGITPVNYRSRCRVGRAIDHMWHSAGAPLALVAIDSGFADQAHMSREFRRWLGVTPGVYGRMLTM